MKKRIPGGFFILIAMALIGISFLQGFFSFASARVYFSHQLEHLVNLRLIYPEESRKTAVTDGLVSFQGRFRENLPEVSEKRFQFLRLLNEVFTLRTRENRLLGDVRQTKLDILLAWKYFLSIRYSDPVLQKVALVQPSHESLEAVEGVVFKGKEIFPYLLSFEKVFNSFQSFISSPKIQDVAIQRDLLQKFYNQLESPVLGIASESLKAHLRACSTLLDETLHYRGLTEHLHALRSIFDHLTIVIRGLDDPSTWNVDWKIRTIRNYHVALKELHEVSMQVEKLDLEIDNIAKQDSEPWFFEDNLVSATSLSKQDPDKFQFWFDKAKESWEQFLHNKGRSFRSPDQVRNRVLEATFRNQEPPPNYFYYIVTCLPLILVGGLLYFSFSRQLKGMGSGAISFGRSPARLLQKGSTKVTFKDVAGADEAKRELQEVVTFLKNPEPFIAIGARIPKGILCVGSPGTGKTLIAKAVAGEANRPFFSMSGSDFVEMFVGVGASRVRDTFDQARKQAPCIVFVDEIDAVGRHRGVGIGGGSDEREQTLNQLLVEMDGFENNEGIILMAATNRPDVLDRALLRPGRFDRRVVIDLPDIKGRFEILSLHAKKKKMAEKVNLMNLARATPGASGADLENILNEAALIAVQRNNLVIQDFDLMEARDKVVFGKERKSLELDQDARWTTAVHESGHAIVAKSLAHCDPVEKVTIIPRGLSLGATYTLPSKNRTGYKRDELEDILAMLLAGRCAEELIIGDISSGAQNDIERATYIAHQMVCEWGMSKHFGLVSFQKKSGDGGYYLGTSNNISHQCSDETLEQIDREIIDRCALAKEKALNILTEKKSFLDQMANLLIEFETLDGLEVDQILNNTFDGEKKRSDLLAIAEKANKKAEENALKESKENSSEDESSNDEVSSENREENDNSPSKDEEK